MTRIPSTSSLYKRAKTSNPYKNWIISLLEFRISLLSGDNSRRVLENVIVRRTAIIAYYYTHSTNVTLINRYRPRASWRSAPVLFVPEETKRDEVKRLEGGPQDDLRARTRPTDLANAEICEDDGAFCESTLVNIFTPGRRREKRICTRAHTRLD